MATGNGVAVCPWCAEPVLPGEEHPGYPQPHHYECGQRAVIGSLAHVLKRCGCYIPGSHENDPPGLTPRQAALVAVEAFQCMVAMERLIKRMNGLAHWPRDHRDRSLPS